MKYTVEEIIDMVAEAVGAIFVIGVFWEFTVSGSPCSLAALVVKMAYLLGG